MCALLMELVKAHFCHNGAANVTVICLYVYSILHSMPSCRDTVGLVTGMAFRVNGKKPRAATR